MRLTYRWQINALFFWWFSYIVVPGLHADKCDDHQQRVKYQVNRKNTFTEDQVRANIIRFLRFKVHEGKLYNKHANNKGIKCDIVM